MRYITLTDTRDTSLITLLNDARFADYEVISVFRDSTERHIAYLRRAKPQIFGEQSPEVQFPEKLKGKKIVK